MSFNLSSSVCLKFFSTSTRRQLSRLQLRGNLRLYIYHYVIYKTTYEENLHIRQSDGAGRRPSHKNKPATASDTAGSHRRRPQAKPYKNKPATTSGQRAVIDSCQEHRQHTIERRSQTRSQQQNQWTVNRGTAEVPKCRKSDVSKCRKSDVSKCRKRCVNVQDRPEMHTRRCAGETGPTRTDAARRSRADGV